MTPTNGFIIEDFTWYNDPQKNHDKVWGIICNNGRYYSFHGKRGDNESSLRAIRFLLADEYELKNTLREKIRKGYKPIDTSTNPDGKYAAIDSVYPGFVTHAKQSLMIRKLDGSILREGDKT